MVLKIELDEKTENQFREAAMRKYGFTRGAIKKASFEALKDWLQQQKRIDSVEIKDPFKLIEGKLSHLRGNYTSVQLQHEAVKLWAMKK